MGKNINWEQVLLISALARAHPVVLNNEGFLFQTNRIKLFEYVSFSP